MRTATTAGELVAGLPAGRSDLDGPMGVVVEQDPGGGAAPRDVDAQERHDGDFSHDDSL